MAETIYPAPYYPIYKPYKTIGGWVVYYLSDRYTMRNVDGGKLHKNRQNAYAKAKRLNKSLPQPLDTVLHGADVAEYEFDNYIIAVGDRSYKGEEGYNLTVAKEALPPHINKDFNTLEEVEEYLNGTLGYTKGARKWTATEREDD